MTLRVVVPSYNCIEWIGRCLDSIAMQTHKDYQVVVIDDCSTDGQDNIIGPYTHAVDWEYRRNGINMGAGYNIYRAILEDLDCQFDDPILLIDGDDFLPHADVFGRVAQLYEDLDTWLMWTQYEPRPYHTTLIDGRPIQVDPSTTTRTQMPSAMYERHETQEYGFFRRVKKFDHLITFRYFLFKESVLASDLQLADGTWPKAGYDKMLITPMLERCGYDHMRFVDEVMYCYNSMNPMSDVSVRLSDAQLASERVDSLLPKPLLDPALVMEIRRGISA